MRICNEPQEFIQLNSLVGFPKSSDVWLHDRVICYKEMNSITSAEISQETYSYWRICCFPVSKTELHFHLLRLETSASQCDK